MACHDHSAHLCLHLHRFVSSTGPDFVEVKRYVLCDDFGDTGWTWSGLGSFNLNRSMLKDSVREKRSQQDEKQVCPFGNFLIRSTSSLHLGLGGAVRRSVI